MIGMYFAVTVGCFCIGCWFIDVFKRRWLAFGFLIAGSAALAGYVSLTNQALGVVIGLGFAASIFFKGFLKAMNL